MHNANTYINVLPNLILSYNNNFHSGIKMIPSEVKDTDENITALMQNWYEKAIQEENNINVNDRVRYIVNFKLFGKKTLPKWSKTVHKIVSCNSHCYVLDNGKIKKYYELQLVDSVQNLNIPENKITRDVLKNRIQ